MTVGAVHADGCGPAPSHLVDPVPTGLPSVISAHGPGYRRAIKPEVLLPGGRQLLSEDPAPPRGSTVLRPNVSARRPGQCVATPGSAGLLNATHHASGTSNAAALASREAYFFYELLQMLRTRSGRPIPEEFEGVLMKALLVHGAEWNGIFGAYENALGGNTQHGLFGSTLRDS